MCIPHMGFISCSGASIPAWFLSMCVFNGAFFLGLVLVLGWLISTIAGPRGPGAPDAPLGSQSFDFGHLLGYAGIFYWAGYLLVRSNAGDSSRGNESHLQPNDQSSGHGQPVVGPASRVLRPFNVVVIIAACTAIFFLWNDGHSIPPPLSIVCRGSYVGKGRVMVITNNSNASMYDVSVKIDNPDGVATEVANELGSRDSKEVGWRQLSSGQLNVGQTAYVYAKGYNAPVITKIY